MIQAWAHMAQRTAERQGHDRCNNAMHMAGRHLANQVNLAHYREHTGAHQSHVVIHGVTDRPADFVIKSSFGRLVDSMIDRVMELPGPPILWSVTHAMAILYVTKVSPSQPFSHPPTH